MMKKTLVVATLLAASSLSMAATTAAKKPVSQWKCEDFLALDESYQPKAIYFAEGFNKKNKPVDAVMDMDGIEKVVPLVVQECQKAPKASFWDKLKAGWDKAKAKI